MKRIKLLVSKTLILILSIIIQLTAFSIMLWKFSDFFVLFYFISLIISIGATLYIVSSPMNPGYKIAWLIVIFAFPFFGVLLYLLYGGKQSVKKMHIKIDSIYSEMQTHLLDEYESTMSELEKQDCHAYRQAYYMKSKSLFPVSQNSCCTYLSPGELAYEVILNELQKAQEFIFLEYFIIDEGIFWDRVLSILKEKVNQGVDVRIIYDDIGTLFTLPPHYERTLRAYGIQCQVFNPFVPILSARINHRDHRKIMLIDGRTVFTGGINIADEYINVITRFGYWKDSVIQVTGDAVWSFTVMFLSTWNYLSKTSENPAIYKREFPFVEEKPSGFVQPYADTPLDYEGVSETVYLNLINKATKYLYITTPYLIIDNEILTALCNASKSGVDVRIITPHIPDKKTVFMMTRSFYPMLLECGIKIYEFTPGFIHSKTFVADDVYGIVGTVNLDYRSLYLHFECGVWMYKADCIADIKADFLHTMEQSKPITLEETLKKNILTRLLNSVLRIFAPLF